MNGGPVSWKCKKQTVVACSTQEAEYIALSLTAREAIWYRHVYEETGKSFGKEPVKLYCDNLGSTKMAKNPIYRSKTKHIDIAVHHIRDEVKKKRVEVEHVAGNLNPADILTKPLAKPAHDECMKMMGMM